MPAALFRPWKPRRDSQDWWRREAERRRARQRASDARADVFLIGFVGLLFGMTVLAIWSRW